MRKLKAYKVTWNETVTTEVEVLAESKKDAIQVAQDRYEGLQDFASIKGPPAKKYVAEDLRDGLSKYFVMAWEKLGFQKTRGEH